MSKKTHIGKNGKPKCVTVWSAHVKHKPSIVVPLEEFQKLAPDKQCKKCLASIDTSNFAQELTQKLGLP
jgi:hypothetical protein